jgi:hypothetical protein
MPDLILPNSFLALLGAFAPCFHAPSTANFTVLVAGWVHCLGRHTITAVAVAAGAVGGRHISVCHRFFARAQWSLDAVGHVLFLLALRWVPTDQPLFLLGDDSLARKQGKCIALASMHYDPLLSTGRKPFFTFGHAWVVLALWVPLPMGPIRGFALPMLCRLVVGSKRGGRADAPSRPGSGRRHQTADLAFAELTRATKLELLRAEVAVMAGWAPERTIYLVVDSAYLGRTLLEQRPANVQVLSRLRMDAALWTPPPPRRPGQKGRPRRRGRRLPNPQAAAARCRKWRSVLVTIYGHTLTTQLFSYTALWYSALRERPLRIVVVRDPTGKRKDEAFFCTAVAVSPAFILEGFARRWTLEVTFHDAKQFLGFEDPQSQTKPAVLRTAPLAFVVYDLVLLWYAGETERADAPAWLWRPWYRHKHAPSFLDMLTTLRLAGWRRWFSQPACFPASAQKGATPWPDAVLATA